MSAGLPAEDIPRLTVAIDGPSGAGKGTVGRRLAHRLHYGYIDTGAMYRAVALVAERQDIPLTDAALVGELAQGLPITFAPGDPPRVLVDGEDVTRLIRSEVCGNGASVVSQHKEVRAALVERQRHLGAEGGVVMDGRDIGTVVFPHAEVKIYLTASSECRVDRRIAQLEARGVPVDPERVRIELEDRDRRDMSRESSPLKKADDAVEIDTSGLGVEGVVDQILALVFAAGRRTKSRA